MTKKTKRARDLRPGDQVLNHNGTARTVTSTRREPSLESMPDVEAATTIFFEGGTQVTLTHDTVCTDEVWVP